MASRHHDTEPERMGNVSGIPPYGVAGAGFRDPDGAGHPAVGAASWTVLVLVPELH